MSEDNDQDDIVLSELPDDELVEQMHAEVAITIQGADDLEALVQALPLLVEALARGPLGPSRQDQAAHLEAALAEYERWRRPAVAPYLAVGSQGVRPLERREPSPEERWPPKSMGTRSVST